MNFSVSPGSLNTPAPLLGEHTSYVLKDLIGLTDEEYESLKEDGVLE
jgi:CoA:oxalate CoA-transferase